MKKKIGILIICVVTMLAMLCVWPLKLVRKDVCEQTGAVEYLSSEVTSGDLTIEQDFTAQQSVLKGVAFAIGFSGESCEVQFQLKDSKGGILEEQMLVIPQSDSGRYYDVSFYQWIKKGEVYTLCIKALNAQNAYILYSSNENIAETARGNIELRAGGAYYDGQAVLKYTYAAPLNYKNVICIWAFILMLAFSVIALFKDKENRFLERVMGQVDKYQYIILGIEILAVTGLIIRSCFTQAVDWDEAYTWDIVKNNSFLGVIRAQAIDNHPPLYFLLVKIAAVLFGNTIFVYKMVSVAGAVASMLLCMSLVRKRWGVRVAMPLILTLGLGAQFIFYNINVRMYSWVVFFVMAAALLAYEILQDTGRKRTWVLFALATLGALYTQYFSAVPLFIIYFYLLIKLAREKNGIKKLLVCCVCVVLAYMPQLYLVVRMLQRDSGIANEEIKASLNLWELCQWSFGTNIKWSEYMPLIAYVAGVLLLAVRWKKLEIKQRGFLVVTALLYPVTWLICWVLSQKMNHFWHNRYMLDAMIFMWIFIVVIFTLQDVVSWICMCVWLGVVCLSAYGIVYSEEMATVPYITEAQQILAEVPAGADVIYNFDTYDTLYKYYLPDANFIWYEDVDFSELDGEYIYMISWGGRQFSGKVIDEYNISIEYIYAFQLEAGVGGVNLCKVHFDNTGMSKRTGGLN